MKPGDMVRYKKFPHEELHNSGAVGVILTEPYVSFYWPDEHYAMQVDVMWDRRRFAGDLGDSAICWDYVDEIEVINGCGK